ncbi:type III-B CRISPR module RAMP protein Cmr1 [Desulfoscipio sp. XC116]|uniref:type III-B CRISPR module RAMP protein Cmr1 n=1 Tax=Desulfoscipio sp. XC116 TaxID=3144975 RepID=UPI00325BD87B
MLKTSLHCKLISPMLSYGANSEQPELRTAELKGLVRFIYRLCKLNPNCNDVQKLYKEESTLFGNTDKASPLRLVMVPGSSLYSCSVEKLVQHKTFKAKAFPSGMEFDILIRTAAGISKERHEDYVRLVILALSLGGMGKRSRRGRGSFAIENKKSNELDACTEMFPTSKAELLDFLLKVMNSPLLSEGSYQIENGDITYYEAQMGKPPFPFITQIKIGEILNDYTKILERIDRASHEVNKTGLSIYTGFVDSKKRLDKDIFNDRKPHRMSSSLLVSMIRLSDGLHPIYTYIKPLFENDKLNDIKCFEDKRDEFVRSVEKGGDQ